MSQSLDATLELFTEYCDTLRFKVFNAGENNELYRVEGEGGTHFNCDRIEIEDDGMVCFYLGDKIVSNVHVTNPRRFVVKLGRTDASFIAE